MISISCNDNNFSRVYKEEFSTKISYIIEKFVKENKIFDTKIIITDNFTEEIISFQKKYNLPIGHTNNGISQVGARVEKIMINDKSQYYIFVNIGALKFENDIISKFIILHELSHIVYYNQIKDKFVQWVRFNTIGSRSNIDCKVNLIIQNFWEEYFANRKAIEYITNNGDIIELMKIYGGQLLELIKEFDSQLINIGNSNKENNKNIEKEEFIRTLFLYYAYISAMRKFNDDISAIYDYVRKKLIIFDSILNEFDRKFNNMYEEYPNVTNLNFDKIKESYLNILNKYNALPKEESILDWDVLQ